MSLDWADVARAALATILVGGIAALAGVAYAFLLAALNPPPTRGIPTHRPARVIREPLPPDPTPGADTSSLTHPMPNAEVARRIAEIVAAEQQGEAR